MFKNSAEVTTSLTFLEGLENRINVYRNAYNEACERLGKLNQVFPND